jgi:hypothetical protein
MKEGTTIPYPARPSQFLALIEQQERMGDWEVIGRNFGIHTVIAFTLREPLTSAKKHEAEGLFYADSAAPVVRLGKVEFDLLRLFEKGEPWDPQVYTNNPYMPNTAKLFLNALFAALVTGTPASAAAMPEAA